MALHRRENESGCAVAGAAEAWKHTDGSRLNHVADGEALDGLVLGCASRAVAAADGLDVATTLLVTAVILSLLDHLGGVVSFLDWATGKGS